MTLWVRQICETTSPGPESPQVQCYLLHLPSALARGICWARFCLHVILGSRTPHHWSMCGLPYFEYQLNFAKLLSSKAHHRLLMTGVYI